MGISRKNALGRKNSKYKGPVASTCLEYALDTGWGPLCSELGGVWCIMYSPVSHGKVLGLFYVGLGPLEE